VKLSSTLIVVFATFAAAATAATPTKRSWATAANGICHTANAEVRKLPTITSTQVWVSDSRTILRLTASFDAKIAAIPQPPSERNLIASLLATERTGERLLREEIAALQRGDRVTLTLLGPEANNATKTYNSQARQLGAWVCAENPVPSG
jgi:hypothetical protein